MLIHKYRNYFKKVYLTVPRHFVFRETRTDPKQKWAKMDTIPGSTDFSAPR